MPAGSLRYRGIASSFDRVSCAKLGFGWSGVFKIRWRSRGTLTAFQTSLSLSGIVSHSHIGRQKSLPFLMSKKWEAVHFAVGVFRPTSLTPLVNACYLDRAPVALKRCRSTDRDVGEVRVLGRLRHLGDSPQRALIQTSADAMRLAKQWPRGPMAVRRGFVRYAGGPPSTWSPGGPLLVRVSCGLPTPRVPRPRRWRPQRDPWSSRSTRWRRWRHSTRKPGLRRIGRARPPAWSRLPRGGA